MTTFLYWNSKFYNQKIFQNLFLVALHVHVQFIPEESSDSCDKLEPVSGLCIWDHTGCFFF